MRPAVLYRSAGGWCDVVATPSGFVWVYSRDTLITCELVTAGLVGGELRAQGRVLWTLTVDSGLLYTRAAAAPNGAVCVVAQRQDGYSQVVIDGKNYGNVGRTYGVTPIVASWHQGLGLFEIAVQTGSSTYDIRRPTTGYREARSMAPTSQGFRDWPDTRTTPIRGDDAHHVTVYGGWKFFEPMTRVGVTVGQTDPTAIRVATADRVWTMVPDGGWNPHVAVLGTQIAVAVRTPARGAALAIADLPYPEHERMSTTPPPVTPPPLKTPAVTVSRFDGLLRDGWHLVTTDRNNPDLELVIDTWVENGAMYQRITHAGGTAKTGAPRQVLP